MELKYIDKVVAAIRGGPNAGDIISCCHWCLRARKKEYDPKMRKWRTPSDVIRCADCGREYCLRECVDKCAHRTVTKKWMCGSEIVRYNKCIYCSIYKDFYDHAVLDFPE